MAQLDLARALSQHDAMRRVVIAFILVSLTAGACTLKEDGTSPPRDVAAPPEDALKTPSGLASKVLRVGVGMGRPSLRSTVVVHYTGWTTDGKIFDSSIARGQPAEFPLTQVIPGWTEGLQLMTVGEKRRFWIPPNLAYGNDHSQPPEMRGMLVFDVELLAVK
jgi:peptidylprolyl isomerase